MGERKLKIAITSLTHAKLAALKSEFNANISGEIYEEDTKWA